MAGLGLGVPSVSVGPGFTVTLTVPDATPVPVVGQVTVALGVHVLPPVAATPAVAVTVAVIEVVNELCAAPAASVTADDVDSVPPSVEKLTGTPARILPFTSRT